MIEILPNWHPLIVHFTIALLLTASALFVMGTLARARPTGAAVTLVARWNLSLGILAALVTLATGWQAYNTVAHDEPSHANMTVHMQWAIGAALVFLIAAGVAWVDRRRPAGAGALLLGLLVIGSGALGVTGWLGGENVYRYGLGVLSLPKSDSHVHPGGETAPHEHGSSGHDHGGGTPAASSDMGGMPGMKSGGNKAQPTDASPVPVPDAKPPATPPAGSAPEHKH